MTGTIVDREVRQDVADVLVRYATGIDRRDWALFRTCFTPDCEADYGDIGVWHGADAITEWMEKSHAGWATRCTASRTRRSWRAATESRLAAMSMRSS